MAIDRARIVADLAALCRFPTVSAQPDRAGDLRRCAAWLADRLRRIGLERVRIAPTARHPIVLGEWRRAPGRPTLLIYGHYDVQPVDPLAEWTSPPFEPSVRGEHLYARGASDDKGQLVAHLAALEAELGRHGRLPVNVVCLLEGEEEIGSPNLGPFLAAERSSLAADLAVVSDMPMLGPDRPALTYALRGSVSLELEVRGPGRDLHSGLFGGAVHNPLQALCSIVAGLHDRDGRVAIPDFYRRVRAWGPAERRFMACQGPTDEQILRDARAESPWGEPGYSLYERTTIRPALNVNGLAGGYAGPGGKGVIPALARAKLDLRLVPDQRPGEIAALARRRIAELTPTTVQSTVRIAGGAAPALVDRREPALRAAAAAYRAGFGVAPAVLRCGGTVPVVNLLQDHLGLPVALMGFALPDDRIHAPNERFHLPTLFRAITTCRALLGELGKPAGAARAGARPLAAGAAR